MTTNLLNGQTRDQYMARLNADIFALVLELEVQCVNKDAMAATLVQIDLQGLARVLTEQNARTRDLLNQVAGVKARGPELEAASVPS